MVYLRAPLTKNISICENDVQRRCPQYGDCCFLSLGRTNLLANVIKRIGRVNGKANQDDVGIWVRQRPQTVVVLLTGRIPQRQLDVLSIDLYIGDVVLEDGRDVDLHAALAYLKRETRLMQMRCGEGAKLSKEPDAKGMGCLEAVCDSENSSRALWFPSRAWKRQVMKRTYLWEGALGEDTGIIACQHWNGKRGGRSCLSRLVRWARQRDSHQQAGLAAGTVANDDQLSAEFSSHGCWRAKRV